MFPQGALHKVGPTTQPLPGRDAQALSVGPVLVGGAKLEVHFSREQKSWLRQDGAVEGHLTWTRHLVNPSVHLEADLDTLPKHCSTFLSLFIVLSPALTALSPSPRFVFGKHLL